MLNQAGTPPEDRPQAAYNLGAGGAARRACSRDAVDALTTFIDQFPDDDRRAQVHFLRGDAYLGMSNWSAAIADFQAYLAARPGLIDSYAYERIGDAQLALAARRTRSPATIRRLTPAGASCRCWRCASGSLRSRRPKDRSADAVAQYDAILKVAQNAPYRAEIALLAAQTLLDAGDDQTGLTRMAQVFNNYPDRPEAYQAMQVLTDHGVELDELDIGRVSFNYGDYQGAIEALNQFAAQHTVGEVPAELDLLLGRAYREIGNTQAALTAFQTIVNQYPTDPLFGDALLEQGRTYFLSGDNDKAIEQYMRVADTYNYLEQAPEALWRAGYLYSTGDQPDKARAVFERLADSYPGYAAGARRLVPRGVAGIQRQYAERRRALLRRTLGQDDRRRSGDRLFLGRADRAAARRSAGGGAGVRGSGASLAGQLLRRPRAGHHHGVEPFAPPAKTEFQFDDGAEIAQAEDWLRATYKIEQTGALWQLAPELQNDPRLVRGRELWDVAAYDEAIAEFDDLVDANSENALASYQLAIYFRGIGAYQNAIVAASYIIRNANVGTLDAPPYIARLRYPAYYLDVVQDVSARRNIDPLLMLSLIRNESLFDTYASGGAGEKGLMQVIPSTAEYIASQLQWANYQHNDLYRPYAGIEFGAYYLWEQLNRFDGNVIASLAGYNAGPGRAMTWLELSGGDPDQFMTAIDIDSTRGYVQRIYSYYNIYRALYSAQTG